MIRINIIYFNCINLAAKSRPFLDNFVLFMKKSISDRGEPVIVKGAGPFHIVDV